MQPAAPGRTFERCSAAVLYPHFSASLQQAWRLERQLLQGGVQHTYGPQPVACPQSTPPLRLYCHRRKSAMR